MTATSSGAREGMLLASTVTAIAITFAWRQWVERSSRSDDLPAEDADYFVRKDRRRVVGTGVLVVIAAGIFVGSWINPKASVQHGQTFVWIWMGVGLLVIVELVLAAIDWHANLGYAGRHRRALIEHRRRLAEEQRRISSTAPGHGQNGVSS